jgi:hypothetical protein
LQPRQFSPFHNIFRYVCVLCACIYVCVCVCVRWMCAWCGLLFLAARSNVKRRLAIEPKCFKGIGLSALPLTGCSKEVKQVQMWFRQSCSKCSYIVR